jgi:4-coumarate--CoA ligase
MIQPVFPPLRVGKDVLIGILPFYHIFGRFVPALQGEGGLRKRITGAVLLLPFAIMLGASVVIMPQYEPDAFCQNIEKYKVTMSFVVPPVCLAILHHPGKRHPR